MIFCGGKNSLRRASKKTFPQKTDFHKKAQNIENNFPKTFL
jgi:hypothetical protein